MSTIAVKINADSVTPITSCLDVGASGNWVIAEENISSLKDVDMVDLYDELSDTVYSSPVQSIVPVKSKDKNNRFMIVFDRDDVTVREQDYKTKGFKFSGYGVRLM